MAKQIKSATRFSRLRRRRHILLPLLDVTTHTPFTCFDDHLEPASLKIDVFHFASVICDDLPTTAHGGFKSRLFRKFTDHSFQSNLDVFKGARFRSRLPFPGGASAGGCLDDLSFDDRLEVIFDGTFRRALWAARRHRDGKDHQRHPSDALLDRNS